MELAIELALSQNFDNIIQSMSSAKQYMAKQWTELRQEKEALLKQKQEIRRDLEMIEREQARLRSERLAFERERTMLESKSLLKDTRQVVKLNVGGKTVTTSTTTLRSIKGTMLDAMFSGRHELCRDEEGSVFIDRDFTYFRMQLPDDRLDRERVFEEFDYFCIPIEEQFPQADFLSKQLVNTQTLTADSWVLCLTVVDDMIVSGHRDGTVRLWDINTGTCIQRFYQPKILPRNDREINEGIERVEVIDKIVIGGGKLLTLWDLDSGEIRGWITPKDVLIGFKVFTGKIYSMWEDGGIRIYDLMTLSQERRWEIPGCWVNCSDIVGSQIVTESIDGFSFSLWDLQKREKLATFFGHSEEVSAIHVRENLNQLVSGSYDKTIKLWDVPGGECIRTFHGHSRSVRAVDVIGNVLISGSHDKTIKVWNLENGKGHTNTVSCLEIVGNMIVTGSWDNTIKIWNVDMDDNIDLLPPSVTPSSPFSVASSGDQQTSATSSFSVPSIYTSSSSPRSFPLSSSLFSDSGTSSLSSSYMSSSSESPSSSPLPPLSSRRAKPIEASLKPTVTIGSEIVKETNKGNTTPTVLISEAESTSREEKLGNESSFSLSGSPNTSSSTYSSLNNSQLGETNADHSPVNRINVNWFLDDNDSPSASPYNSPYTSLNCSPVDFLATNTNTNFAASTKTNTNAQIYKGPTVEYYYDEDDSFVNNRNSSSPKNSKAKTTSKHRSSNTDTTHTSTAANAPSTNSGKKRRGKRSRRLAAQYLTRSKDDNK